ncbi:Mcbg like protein albicidin resistance [Pseudomonas savastanoi pv. glycinea]|uniref:Mcbg like protein albicidin resistance n=8 Tax=Pseudomonas TaxID=286 RepID=A0A0P9QLL7_PSEA0|nr:pentapeptide repeat-containing protein [Pseudomonas savastanoi]EFW77422.1 mcbg like protein; putative albicidin resistance [Pseudomonas savastanoi pv. glycinea str. B076]EFW82932.1 mcbg like protein; putative albicidin resistance [Pseudomonas savastanoi pv. glycinea str. race 4]EGH27336.1 mcbg like protein; albicidin resistance [Pseudomonas amygdali pv. mori str. 301020]KPX29892.1 Mcbg like protein albicidin resistance [Pseudomonas amygdali pv. eriobotryae]KPX49074.1 hypothetical protein AL
MKNYSKDKNARMKRIRHLEQREFCELDLSDKKIADWSFSSCKFIKCNFSGAKLHKCQFDSCEFIGCDASNVTLGRSQFIDVRFNECKLLGLDWNEAASPLKLAFHKSRLDYNVFTNRNLVGLECVECFLRDAFFQKCDLTRSSFCGSDLCHTQFEECKFHYADMSDTINFGISPENNDITHAIMSVDGALALLHKYQLTIR